MTQPNLEVLNSIALPLSKSPRTFGTYPRKALRNNSSKQPTKEWEPTEKSIFPVMENSTIKLISSRKILKKSLLESSTAKSFTFFNKENLDIVAYHQRSSLNS
jgi:hypothetical protein